MLHSYFRPDVYCPVELAVLVTATFSFLSVWVALGRGPWLQRFAVCCAGLLLLLPVRAYQPFVFLTLLGLLTAVPLAMARWYSSGFRIARVEPSAASSGSKSAIIFAVAATFLVGVVVASVLQSHVQQISTHEHLLALILTLPATFVAVLAIDDRIHGGRWRITPKPRTTRFSLLQAMTLMLLLGILFAAISFALRCQPIINWKTLTPALITLGLLNTLIAGSVLLRAKRWKLLSLLLVFPVLTWATFNDGAAGTWLIEMSPLGGMQAAAGQLAWAVATRLYAAVLASILLPVVAAEYLWMTPLAEEKRTFLRKSARVVCIALACVLVFSIAPPLFRMSRPIQGPVPFVGDEEVLLQIGDLATRFVASDQGVQSNDRLQSTMQSVSRLATRPFRVGIGPKNPNHFARSIAIRKFSSRSANLAFGFCGNERYNEAAAIWLGLSKLGDGLVCGFDGSAGDFLMGCAIQSIAMEGQAAYRDQLATEQCLGLLNELIRQEKCREPIESIRRRCDKRFEQDYGWRYRFAIEAQRTFSVQPAEHQETLITATIEAMEDAIRRRDVLRRLLIAELAIKLYREDQGKFPDNLQTLTPQFISEPPIDPWSPGGRSLVYRRTDDRYVLYSVGVDGVDDGAVFGSAAESYASGFDFDLNTPARLNDDLEESP
ncbi:MAG: hypothetical protein AAFU85_20495 [Planctomycetota bacterium]